MKIKNIWSLVMGIMLVGIVIAFVAAPVSAAGPVFLTPITVTDTTGTAQTNVTAIVPINTSTMQQVGMMSSTGLDTWLGLGTSPLQYMLTNTGINIYQGAMAPYQQGIDSLYSNGYSPTQTSLAIIPGNGGYITTTDNAALEPGNNFSQTWSGWLDTTAGASKNLGSKTNALQTYVDPSVSGTVNAGVYG